MKKHNYKVLNHGFVKLIDYMGSDADIAEAARVSYGEKSKSGDRALLRYMMSHRHTSPFEMAELKFHVKLPIFVARQWIRHRTASVNEISGRYTQLKEEHYIPDKWRKQSTTNKQGSSDKEVYIDGDIYNWVMSDTYEQYKEFIRDGVTKEQARIVLPLSIYTEWYWKMDLHNLFHFLSLRLEKHAQQEIREYAETIALVVRDLFPISWEAFVDYRLEAKTFSKQEMEIIKYFKAHPSHSARDKANELKEQLGMTKREIDEFIEKIDGEW